MVYEYYAANCGNAVSNCKSVGCGCEGVVGGDKVKNLKKREYIRDGRAPIPEKEMTSRIMSSIRDRNTKPETILRSELWKNGIRGYRLHVKNIPGRPDIAFPRKRLAIFVNGCFWHRCPLCNLSLPKSHTDFWRDKFDKNIERDKRKVDQLKTLGWKVITIWECQINYSAAKQIGTIKTKLK